MIDRHAPEPPVEPLLPGPATVTARLRVLGLTALLLVSANQVLADSGSHSRVIVRPTPVPWAILGRPGGDRIPGGMQVVTIRERRMEDSPSWVKPGDRVDVELVSGNRLFSRLRALRVSSETRWVGPTKLELRTTDVLAEQDMAADMLEAGASGELQVVLRESPRRRGPRP